MICVRVALIDDRPNAHQYLRKVFAGHAGAEAELVEGISLRINTKSSEAVHSALRLYKGPLLLILDLDLNLPGRAALFDRLDRALATSSSLEAGAARNFVAQRRSTPPEEQGIDGLDFAWTAVQNKNIDPLSIYISTRTTSLVENCRLTLLALADQYRKRDCFSVQGIPTGISISGASESDYTQKQVFDEAIAPAINDFRRLIAACSADAHDRLDTFLKWIEDAHTPLDDHLAKGNLREFVSPEMKKLLDISDEEWNDPLWLHLANGPNLAETFKTFGSKSRTSFSPAGAWLIALAAFRASGDRRPWTDVFSPKELSEDKEDGWKTVSITPLLTVNELFGGNTMHDCIRRYFTMCLELFNAKGKNRGPLERVTLTLSSLEFELAFDAWSPQDDCLVSKIRKWRDGYLGRSSGYNWENSSRRTQAGASAAVFEFWLATALSDYQPKIYDPLFAPSRNWAFTIERRPKGKTTVCFRGR